MSFLGISKIEFKIVVLLSIFGAAWMLLVVPQLIQSSWFQTQNPLTQYLIYNIGQWALTAGLLGIPIGKLAEAGSRLNRMLRASISTFISFSWVLDMWQPPFYLDPAGHTIITNAASLPSVSVDATWAWIWSILFPSVLNTSTLYILVYLVTPFIGLILAAMILQPKRFTRMLLHAV